MADLTATSKHLSYVLRHRPESIGIVLDGAGWVDIDVLMTALRDHGRTVTRADLDRIVAGTDKRRFEVSGDRIRAAQGHSVEVDLELTPVHPPALLYHGTVARFVAAIRTNGLRPGKRRHVHLSADAATAATVGARRGQPVILTIDAAGMHGDGHEFYLAANGVWLTDHVPPRWITEP